MVYAEPTILLCMGSICHVLVTVEAPRSLMGIQLRDGNVCPPTVIDLQNVGGEFSLHADNYT